MLSSLIRLLPRCSTSSGVLRYATKTTPKPRLSYSDLFSQWHPVLNKIGMEDADTAKKHWWWCPKGPDHEWQASILYRLRPRGCPFCDGKRVSVTNSLATRYPAIAAQWHPTQNGALLPSEVTQSSMKTVWWICPKDPTHEWIARVQSRTREGKGCPYCWTIRRSPNSKKREEDRSSVNENAAEKDKTASDE
mmetsp:Transcript_42886/g.69566  ORF Transcript_42886/g.69566 Transcript_42886/m.69566 type:complete len:192 (+) Transcript_42886:77-652(+)